MTVSEQYEEAFTKVIRDQDAGMDWKLPNGVDAMVAANEKRLKNAQAIDRALRSHMAIRPVLAQLDSFGGIEGLDVKTIVHEAGPLITQLKRQPVLPQRPDDVIICLNQKKYPLAAQLRDFNCSLNYNAVELHRAELGLESLFYMLLNVTAKRPTAPLADVRRHMEGQTVHQLDIAETLAVLRVRPDILRDRKVLVLPSTYDNGDPIVFEHCQGKDYLKGQCKDHDFTDHIFLTADQVIF